MTPRSRRIFYTQTKRKGQVRLGFCHVDIYDHTNGTLAIGKDKPQIQFFKIQTGRLFFTHTKKMTSRIIFRSWCNYFYVYVLQIQAVIYSFRTSIYAYIWNTYTYMSIYIGPITKSKYSPKCIPRKIKSNM